jgi:class 3 adenylate cyclase
MENIETNKYTLRFKDSELENKFVAFHRRTTTKHTRSSIIVALILFYLFHFIDGQIVSGLSTQADVQKTVVENILNDNPLLHNKVTSLVTDTFEDILLQDKKFTNELESNIWKIRYNTLILGAILLGFTYIKRFRRYTEYFAAAIGVFGAIAISIMISYVSGMASYIYLSGLMLVIVWLAILSRIRFVVAFWAVLISIGLNNIITSNRFLFELFHESTNLVGSLVTKGQLTINLPINNFFLLSTIFLALYATHTIEKYARENFIKNKENEELLLNILPEEIAEIKKQDSEKVIARRYESASLLFSDIVGFTEFSSHHEPEELITLLNSLYSRFDDLTKKHNIEKIKTMGDGYMLASGVPTEDENHARNMANMALAMFDELDQFNKNNPKANFSIRVGISSGPVVAGVVGKVKFAYDIWGDTVNTASRMESGGVKSKIQVSPDTYEILKYEYNFEKRSELREFKGKGKIQTYFLVGKKDKNSKDDELLLCNLSKDIEEIINQKDIVQKDKSASLLFCQFSKYGEELNSCTKDEKLLYTQFDNLAYQYHTSKLETIQSEYMLVSGIPTEDKNHAKNIADMALAMFEELKRFNTENRAKLNMKIGISSGPVVDGVDGKVKFSHGFLESTVQTTTDMELYGIYGKIQVSLSTYELLKEQYEFEQREDEIDINGTGKIKTYFLISKKQI